MSWQATGNQKMKLERGALSAEMIMFKKNVLHK